MTRRCWILKIVNREKTWFMPTVRRWPLALARGDGSRVWDLDGNEYVDLTAGWGVTSIGHCHPELVEALCDQARTLMHTTNVVYTEPQLDLAERLGAHRALPRACSARSSRRGRRRGQRGRAQARCAPHGARPLRRHPRQLPRAHARRARLPGPGEVPRSVEGAGARGELRPLRRRLRRARCARFEHRCHDRRTGAGRGRRERSARRLPERAAPRVRRRRRAADPRRGADRPGPHGPLACAGARRRAPPTS